MVNFQVMTLEEYKANYSDFNILYSFHTTIFGKCLLGVRDKDRAILHLSFVQKSNEFALNDLECQWPYSTFIKDMDKEIGKKVQSIFSKDAHSDDSITVLLKGTEFQSKVWSFLPSVPQGTSVTYEDVAEGIGKPKAVRAVGNALAKNQVAYLVPCHRVKGKSGNDKYTWGIQLKHALLILERKKTQPDSLTKC